MNDTYYRCEYEGFDCFICDYTRMLEHANNWADLHLLEVTEKTITWGEGFPEAILLNNTIFAIEIEISGSIAKIIKQEKYIYANDERLEYKGE